MNGLTIHCLSTGYGRKRIIHQFSVPELVPGNITILLGPNGCGKSTLLRALAGLNPAEGELWLNGNNLLTMPFALRSKDVVFLPQSLPQGVHLRVLESMLVALRAGGNEDARDGEAQAIAVLKGLGIVHLALCYLDQLSGGQKQLVGLAQSLVRKPLLLLLDEPLSALDLHHQFQVMAQVVRETRRRNMVTVMVVHDMNIAMRYGDTIIMLKDGNPIASGKPEQVITAKTLADVYGVRGRIERCSQGRPQVILEGIP